MKRELLMFMVTIFCLSILACGGGGGSSNDSNGNGSTCVPETSPTASFQDDIQPIFDNFGCVGCHSASGVASFMVLTNDESYDNLVSVSASRSSGKRVVPCDSAKSVLYLRVSGTSLGIQMPKDSPPLSQELQNTIQDWIDEGAQNN